MDSKSQDRTDPGSQKGITVDWIVVTVSLIGLAVVAVASFQAGEGSLASMLRDVF